MADSIFLFWAWLELGLVKDFRTELCKFWVTIRGQNGPLASIVEIFGPIALFAK